MDENLITMIGQVYGHEIIQTIQHSAIILLQLVLTEYKNYDDEVIHHRQIQRQQ